MKQMPGALYKTAEIAFTAIIALLFVMVSIAKPETSPNHSIRIESSACPPNSAQGGGIDCFNPGKQIKDPILTQINKWGWDFTKSKWAFEGVYDTNDGPRVLLYEKPCCDSTKASLWDPLTGATQSLDRQERQRFIVTNKGISWPVGRVGQFVIPVDDKGRIKVDHDFGGEPCIPATYNTYYVEYDLEGHRLRSFYVIMRLTSPRHVEWQMCGDGEFWVVRFNQSTIDIGSATMAPLQDGTALIWIRNARSLDGGYLLRLDQSLRAHSTVGGRLFVINHDAMEHRFRASGAWRDPKRRAEIMDAYIDSLVTSKHN